MNVFALIAISQAFKNGLTKSDVSCLTSKQTENYRENLSIHETQICSYTVLPAEGSRDHSYSVVLSLSGPNIILHVYSSPLPQSSFRLRLIKPL